MTLLEIFDLDNHVSESKQASEFLELVRSRFSGPQRMYFRNTPYEDLTVDFFKPKRGDAAANIHGENGFFRMEFAVDGDLSSYVNSKRFESLLRHEFQHYLDIKARYYDMADYAKNNHDDEYYHNNDLEYAAFFKQQAEPLLKILRGEDNTTKVEPDFSEFIRNGQHYSMIKSPDGGGTVNRYEKFDKKYKMRYLKDMAILHKAVVAIDGVSGKYKLDFREKIWHWVLRKLSK